jgi:hypothetical protein
MPRPLIPLGLFVAVLLATPSMGQPPGQDVVRLTDRRVAAWQPTKEEKAFDRIGWSTTIESALALAGEHRRPVFLFTHDGRMAIGRQ